jgi:hypothetical protein
MVCPAAVLSRMPEAQLSGLLAPQLAWSRVPAAMDGAVFLSLFVLLILMQVLNEAGGSFDADFDTPAQIVEFIIQVAPSLILTFLVPIPLAVAGFNLAPTTGWRRLAVLTGVTFGFMAYCVIFTWPEVEYFHDAWTILIIMLVFEFRWMVLCSFLGRGASPLVMRVLI